MHLRILALVSALFLALVPVASVAQPTCTFPSFFEAFREMAGSDIVGDCTGAPIEAASGELTQATTNGVLTRKPDGLVLFANDTTTWLAGPEGIQSRVNTDRMSWEVASEQATSPAASGNTSQNSPAATPTPATKSMAALEQRCSDIIASIPDRGAPTRDQQWGTCVNLAEEHGAAGVDCYADATKKIAPNIGKISRETTNAVFDAALTVCKGSIR